MKAVKAKREVERLKKQAIGLIWRPLGAIKRNLYDASRERQVRITQGELDPKSEIAVLLIYQPKGLLKSTLFTLSYLAERGIAPVVVSNLPLADSDREKLIALSWLVIERPNIGYDFGGYREGVLSVLERITSLDALYLFNDSMWFPLYGDSDAIEQCRAANEDVFGLFVSRLSNRRIPREHVQSYFFRFSKKLIKEIEFANYWRRMKLIDHKATVVRVHERNLAWHFAGRGFSASGLINWRSIIDYIMRLEDEERLARIFEYQCEVSPREAELIQPVLARHGSAFSQRDQLSGLIERRKIFVDMFELHPWILQGLQMPFLKKARTPNLVLQRSEILRLGLQNNFHPDVRDEIERWDAN